MRSRGRRLVLMFAGFVCLVVLAVVGLWIHHAWYATPSMAEIDIRKYKVGMTIHEAIALMRRKALEGRLDEIEGTVQTVFQDDSAIHLTFKKGVLTEANCLVPPPWDRLRKWLGF